jgi:hypothetical protein
MYAKYQPKLVIGIIRNCNTMTDRESATIFRLTTQMMEVNEQIDKIQISSCVPFLPTIPDVMNA